MNTRIAIAVLLALCGPLRVHAEANAQEVHDFLLGPPPVEGPLAVRIGFNLMNITDVSERQETIDFDGAL